MSRNKTIFSVIIMVGLVIISIIIPTIWRSEQQKQKTENTDPVSETTVTDQPETEVITLSLDFPEWDQLKILFSQKQIESLKEQFPEYLILMDKTKIDSVRFLPEATTYPQGSEILLQFALSDSSILPVTYSTEQGAFFFGKEKRQINTEDLSSEQTASEEVTD